MEYLIPFNKPYLTGYELSYIEESIKNGHISGNGIFTKKCHSFFEERYNFSKVLLTTSCTDALEMCAMLLNIKPNDEIIVPSYTFVSSALAFVRQGAKIVFADSSEETPNIDVEKLEALITPNTKAIVAVHYAGFSCDMDKLMSIANKHGIYVIEDAAQAIESFYNNRPLGGIGHLGCFSFHETKNIQCGEGGLLIINDKTLSSRAEILWEKGTNRAEFFRGQVNKYGWVDTGSSFLPSELNSAFLYAQLENIEKIQNKRIELWENYYNSLKYLEVSGKLKLPKLPKYASNNAHMFYILMPNLEQRSKLIDFLKENKILSVFHYQSLHKSKYYQKISVDKNDLRFSDYYTDTLLRLPLYFELTIDDQNRIIKLIKSFFQEIS